MKMKLLLILLLAGSCVFAETISLNFIGSAGASGTLGSTDQAGLVGTESGNSLGSTMAGNWNNLSGNTGSGVGSLTDSSGSVVGGVTASWSADNTYALIDTTSGANTSANTAMMKGYLDNASENTTSITLSGLEAIDGSYSVIVYFDGDNEEYWRRGIYSIGAGSVTGEDSENVDFNSGSGNNADGLFQIPVSGGTGNLDWPQSPNNGEGNFIIFSGLTGSSFTLTADPTDTDSPLGQRAPINGIQVVGVVPEPASALMLLAGGGLIALKRRFFSKV